MNNQSQNELAHFGVLGMKWGRSKATSSSKKPTKTSKGKLTFNSKKLINGRSLTQDILGNIGIVAVTHASGSILYASGMEKTGQILSKAGKLYASGATIGDMLNRVERQPVK